MEKVAYGGWPNCYRLRGWIAPSALSERAARHPPDSPDACGGSQSAATHGEVEVIVTGDVGPRIIRLGFVGEENEFVEFPEHVGLTGGQEWRIYGGHRLWHSPEDRVRSYYPDNFPVEVAATDGAMRVVQPAEPTTGIEKEMVISLAGANQVVVRHVLRNKGLWPVELAPWALSMMAPGGMAIIPQPATAHPDGLLPNRVLVLWPYSDMADPRVQWGSRFIMVHQDPEAQTPFKVGLSADDGWLAYLRRDHLFVKTFEYVEGATYPDHGCSVQVYTNDRFLEIETLGPLQRLAPQAAVEHVECWFLFRGVESISDVSALATESRGLAGQ